MVTRADQENREAGYLKSGNYSPVGEATEHVSHVSISCRRDVTFSEVVPICSIETCGNCEGVRGYVGRAWEIVTEYQFRGKLDGDRHDYLMKNVEVICISHSRFRPRDVDGAENALAANWLMALIYTIPNQRLFHTIWDRRARRKDRRSHPHIGELICKAQ